MPCVVDMPGLINRRDRGEVLDRGRGTPPAGQVVRSDAEHFPGFVVVKFDFAPSHGGNAGSNPAGDAEIFRYFKEL